MKDIDVLIGESSITVTGTESRWSALLCRFGVHKWTLWNYLPKQSESIFSCEYQTRNCVVCGKFQKAFVLMGRY